MKYSLIFAATAAAYDAYDAYSKQPEPVTPTCYTTVTPGYGKEPVTVTQQHQAYPTCVSKGYDGKSCDKWGEDNYVSTTIKDYNSKDVCITKMDQPVTIYYEKKTITHTTTVGYGGYATPAGYTAAKPTGAEYKIDDKGCWYELYEKIETAPYNKLGSHALPGYPGSGICKDSDNTQQVYVKEYKNGKWNEYTTARSYGKPTAYVTNYAKPGVYTVPAKDMYVDSTMYYGAEVTKTAKAGETCTYGGKWTDATATGYITVPYGAYDTTVDNGKTSTAQVVKYTTIYVSTTGKVEVCKPTTTVYDKDTTYAYPTATYYEPGIYHYDAKVVTITKPNQDYTCDYEQRMYQATPTNGYPSYPTYVPADSNPGYQPAAPYPSSNPGYQPVTPPYPSNGNSTYGATPSGSPVYPANGQPGYPSSGYPSSEYPSKDQPTKPYAAKPEETPCDEDDKTSEPTKAYPAKPEETPCDEDDKTNGYPVKPTDNQTGYPQQPYDNTYPAQPSANAYPAQPSANAYPAQPSANAYPAQPSANAYPAQPSANAYPAQPSNIY